MISRNRWLLAVVVLLTFMVLGIVSATAQEPPAEKKPLFKVEKFGSWTESLAFTPDSQRLACDLILRGCRCPDPRVYAAIAGVLVSRGR